MNIIHTGTSAKRSDPTRTTEAKRDTIARKAARTAKYAGVTK